MMTFIEETFSLKVAFEKDLSAKNLKVAKSKTTNRIIIKNICITIKQTLNIYIKNPAKIGNITFKKTKIS